MIKPLYLLSLALVSVSAFAQVDPNRTVAVINGEEVKGAEYYRRMEFLPGVAKRVGTDLAEFPPGFLTLEQLITERLILQLAKEKGCLPSDPEVDQEIRFRLEDNPRVLEDAKAAGRTEAEFRADVKIELAQFKIQTFGVNITDQDVQTIYKARPQDYTIPKRFTLRVIAVNGDAAAAKADELLKTKSFGDVAKQVSIDITKTTGGEFGTLPVSALSPSMQMALEAVKIGGTTGWLSSEERRVKFLLEDVIPAKLQELTPSLKRQIRNREMLSRGTVRNNIQAEMKAVRAKAQIDIKEKAFAEAYKTFIEQYVTGAGGG